MMLQTMSKRLTEQVQQLQLWWGSRSPTTQNRLAGIALLLCSAPILITARWLEADPSGVGTHRQLGLGGCTVLTWTGWPCPMCGMTTTFTHMAHGDLLSALVTQPFGVVLFLTTVVLFVTGVGSFAGYRWWRRLLAWLMSYELPIAAGTLIGMALGWCYKVLSMGILG